MRFTKYKIGKWEVGMNEYRKRIYSEYVSDSYGEFHSFNEKEYKRTDKYYKKNHYKFLPDDKEARILELGCGGGHCFHALKSLGYKNYTAVDASRQCVEITKSIGAPKVILGDLTEYLDNCNGKYDVVIMNDVIEHFTKEEVFHVLDGIYSVLEKGGCVLLKTDNMSNPFVGADGRYIDFTHEIGFTPMSIKQVLMAAGFERIKVVGTNIYVLNPIISGIAYAVSKILSILLRILFVFYGRTTTKIFEKDILAIAYKREDTV